MKESKVLAFVSNDFEDLEVWYPVLRLREAGVRVDVAGEEKEKEYTGKQGLTITAEVSFNDVNYFDYDGILVPGGWAPDTLRQIPKVLEIVRYFNDERKIIGQICHAGWVLLSAGILKGVNVTSVAAIKDDMINGGANWVDKSVVVDGHIISSRRPPDLPDYMKDDIEVLKIHVNKNATN